MMGAAEKYYVTDTMAAVGAFAISLLPVGNPGGRPSVVKQRHEFRTVGAPAAALVDKSLMRAISAAEKENWEKDKLSQLFPGAIEERFRSLVANWEKNRPRGVDVSEMVLHESYQAIIRMDKLAIPFLLRELAKKPSHWFVALHKITGENPIPAKDQGNIRLMAEAWISWGKSQGYLI